MNVVVDTSVWSLAFRRRTSALNAQERDMVQELGELVREGRVLLIGPVRQGILSGIRDQEAFDRLRDRLRAFRDEPLDTEDYEVAAAFGNLCRAGAIAGSAVDFLLCAVAMRRQAALFTADADFGRYATRIPILLHRPRTTGA